MSEIVSESDFCSDNSLKDPDFYPSTSNRKRKLIKESERPLKKVCMVSSSDGQKIIFKNEFNTEVEKISDKTTCAKCVVCHRVIKGSYEVTSNFIKHLRFKHIELFKKFTDNEIDTGPSSQDHTKPDRRSAIKHQFFSYLNDNSSADGNWQKYDLLKEAFIYFNTPLTSSAPVERLFSFAGIVNSPRRQSLSDFSFEKLVLMKVNCKNMLLQVSDRLFGQ